MLQINMEGLQFIQQDIMGMQKLLKSWHALDKQYFIKDFLVQVFSSTDYIKMVQYLLFWNDVLNKLLNKHSFGKK